jgi:hypothetical protein
MGDVLIEAYEWAIKNWLASVAIIVALWGCVFGVVHKYFTSTNKIVVIKSVLTTTVIVGLFVAIGFGIYYFTNPKQDEEKIQNILLEANKAFDNKQFDDAFHLYKKAKSLGSKDEAGYNNFMNQAKKLREILGENHKKIETHLNRAKELSNTPEVNKLLEQYK